MGYENQLEQLASSFYNADDVDNMVVNLEEFEGSPSYSSIPEEELTQQEPSIQRGEVDVQAPSENDVEANMQRIWGSDIPELQLPTNIDIAAILGEKEELKDPTIMGQSPEIQAKYGDTPIYRTGLLRPIEDIPTDRMGLHTPIESSKPSNVEAAAEGTITPVDIKRAKELQTILDYDPRTQVSIEYGADGQKKSVTLVGSPDNTEFQGLGKYRTPQEFMAANPEGFRLTNPGLWRKMNEERTSQVAQQYKAPATQMTVQQVTERFRAIDSIPDFKDRAVAIAQLEGDIAKTQTEFRQSAEQQARAQLGIDKNIQDLQISMKRDREHPMFLQSGGKPSIETTALAQQLKTAEKAYPQVVKSLINNNPLLNEITSASKMLTRLSEKQLEMDWRKAETKEEKALLKKEIEIAKVEEFSTSLGPKKGLVAMMWPDIGADMGAVKSRLELETRKDPKRGKEFAEALEAGEQGAFRLALRGNEYATEIAIGKTVRDKGISREEARKQLYPFAAIVASNEAAKEAATEMGLLGKKQVTGKAIDPNVELAQMATNPDLMKNSGLREASIDARIRLAEKYADFKVTKNFGDDITKWQVKSKTMQEYLDNPAKNNGKPISINTIIDDIRERPPAQRIEAFRDLRRAFEASAEAVNKNSAYGQMNITGMRNKLEARMAVTSFFEELGEGLTIWR